MKFLVLLSLFTLASCGFEIVDTGNRGVLTNMGKVVGEPLPEGLQFYNPFSEDVHEMNVRETTVEYKLNAYSKDNQQLTVVVSIVYMPVSSKVHLIYREFGEDYFTQIANKSIVDGIGDTLGQYSADTIISERGKLRKQTLVLLQEKLLSRHIQITDVSFTMMKFQPEYEQAVEAKVVAIQRAEEAKNKTEEVREMKAQAILQAEGQAESIRIRSAALQQNAKLVEFEAIQKWDGKLPQQMFGGGAVPFINLTK